MTKRVFVSDVHMGTGLSLANRHRYDWLCEDQATAFVEFLKYLSEDDSFDELILVGDILDDWVYPIDLRPPQYSEIAAARKNPDIINGLKTIAKKKPVTYLAGNHDMTIANNSIANFGNGAAPNVTFQQSYENVPGLIAEHGHQYSVWNAVDPANNLPIGHYISRLNASLDLMGDQRQRWQDALGHALPDLLRANPDVNAPLDFLARKLGIDENVALITGLTVRQSPSIRSRPYMRI